jgi:1-acyl-sn-glycerol-3-phosphate acyltransferase
VEDWKLLPAKDHGLKPGQRLRSLSRESGLLETAGHMLWWSMVRAYLGLYHRLRIHGRNNIPVEPPFILAANHASHLDALVLAAPLPLRLRDRIFPIAAGDVFFETPVIAAFAAWFLNALPMWRKNCGPHALQQLRERLVAEPCSYILFPEGGRTRTGQPMAFKPGIGMLVAGTKVPVVPCHLDGTFEALPPETKLPRFRRITLRIGKPMVFDSANNDRPGWQGIAAALAEAVNGLAPKT